MFGERLSIYVCASFPFSFDGGMWDLFVFVPDYYFSSILYDNLAFSRLKSLKSGLLSILFSPITLDDSRNTIHDFATISFHFCQFSAAFNEWQNKF